MGKAFLGVCHFMIIGSEGSEGIASCFYSRVHTNLHGVFHLQFDLGSWMGRAFAGREGEGGGGLGNPESSAVGSLHLGYDEMVRGQESEIVDEIYARSNIPRITTWFCLDKK